MTRSNAYNGSLTAEQFLFYEIRIAARFYLDGVAIEQAIDEIKNENLFQYPTEREVSRMTRACYKRLASLENCELIRELAFAPAEIAKQINLYAIMRYNRLVWEFMTGVVGEKYRCQDFSFSSKDVAAFFSRLRAQNDTVAAWSDGTIRKIMSVLTRMLVETEYLDSIKSSNLNPVFLYEELERGIYANGDTEALSAFNCFK